MNFRHLLGCDTIVKDSVQAISAVEGLFLESFKTHDEETLCAYCFIEVHIANMIKESK